MLLFEAIYIHSNREKKAFTVMTFPSWMNILSAYSAQLVLDRKI